MTATYLSQLTVDNVLALDPGGKFQRIYVDSGSIAVPAGVAINGPVAISSLPPPSRPPAPSPPRWPPRWARRPRSRDST